MVRIMVNMVKAILMISDNGQVSAIRKVVVEGSALIHVT